MDQNRSILEAELKALMEVSSDFARGLSTVAARMKVLKSCLDKSHESSGRVSRVDRATSPIVFRTDRSTSVSPLRFKSPVKLKEESLDIQEEAIADAFGEQHYCDIKQEKSKHVQDAESSTDSSKKKKSAERCEEEFTGVSSNGTPREYDSGASSSANVTVEIAATEPQRRRPTAMAAVPLQNPSANVRKSYFVVNPSNGLAIPIDVSQIKDLGLSKNPIQQITVQHNEQIEEDILYAMQENVKNSSTNNCSTTSTVAEEIYLSTDEENSKPTKARMYAGRIPLSRVHGVIKKSLTEKREDNRRRQAKYRASHKILEKKDKCMREKRTPIVNNLNSILNSGFEGKQAAGDTVPNSVLILRKDLIKKTYARERKLTEN